MAASGSSRNRWAAAGVGGAALLGVAGFTGWQYQQKPAVQGLSPAPGSAVPTTSPNIVMRLSGADRLGDLRVRVNGRDLTASARGARDRLIIPTRGLRDGSQRVDVSFRTDNLFARTVRRRWDFTVDTSAPTLSARSPREGEISRFRTVRFTGSAEAGAAVAVRWKGGTATGVAARDGAYAVRAKLPEGPVDATVTATDRAGNSTATANRVLVDTIAPAIEVTPAGGPLTDTAAARISGRVVRDDPRSLTFGATVNGTEAIAVSGASALGTGTDTGLVEAAYTETPLQLDGRRFSLGVGELPQGVSNVSVWVRDPAGNVATKTVKVMVDSTEEFGASDLRMGARGEDVRTLGERLKQARVLKGRVTASFGPRTRQAVIRYQGRHRLPKTGVVDARTREAMVGRIVVDLSEFTLRLIRDGRVVKKYKVAIGQPAYPTPTGTYEVVNKQMNPTWIPPNSPWAKGLGSIPPGPGNPLGTRWIGTSAPAVGIHGTYADYSIGTAASHGCMRMHIPDVEALYDDVSVGMPVIIKA